MLLRNAATRPPVGLAPWLCLLALAAVGCSPAQYPQTALLPISDFAHIGDRIQDQTFYWALGVFVLVEGALLYAVFRFRGRPGDPEPKQIHGNTTVEIIWTIVPALILAAIAVPTVKGIFETAEQPGGDALTVEVVGHQWWWEFRYPEYGLVTANELVIPAGRTVHLKQNSADVIHSFWPPRFAGKRDVFPGRETRLWFKTDSTGLFPGQCAEFCGIQHARMAFHVRSETAAGFEQWVSRMSALGAPAAAPAPAGASADSLRTASVGANVQQPAPADGLVAQGEQLFKTKGCIGCHSLQGKGAPTALIGPNLANVGERAYIAAGWLRNTDENLEAWIQNPQGLKKGVLMPNLGVKPDEAKALRAYLRAHK